MFAWLSENLVNIVIIAVLVLVVFLLVRGMIRDRKAGKSSCGGNCASCGMCAGHAAVRNEQPGGSEHLIRTRVAVDGMMCGMCEAHINDAIRKAMPVKKVSSSHTKGETLIITEDRPDPEVIRRAINGTGYTVVSVVSSPEIEKQRLRPNFG